MIAGGGRRAGASPLDVLVTHTIRFNIPDKLTTMTSSRLRPIKRGYCAEGIYHRVCDLDFTSNYVELRNIVRFVANKHVITRMCVVSVSDIFKVGLK